MPKTIEIVELFYLKAITGMFDGRYIIVCTVLIIVYCLALKSLQHGVECMAI